MSGIYFNRVSNMENLSYSKEIGNQHNVSTKKALIEGAAKKNEDSYAKNTVEPTDADKVSAQKQAEAHQKQLDDIEKAKRANTIKTKTEVNPNNGQKLTIVTKYDSMGNEDNITVTREDGSVSCVSNFKDGKQISMVAYFSNGTVAQKTEFENGKISKDVTYSSNGNVETTRTCEYYPNGNLKSDVSEGGLVPSSETYYENGQLKQRKQGGIIFEYNEKGQKIKETTISKKPNLAGISTYEYNEDGKEISSHRYALDGKTLIERTESEYTETKELHKMYDQNGNLKYTIEYEEMPDGSTVQRENGEFKRRVKEVQGETFKETGDTETYYMNEAGETIAVEKPVIEKDEEGQEYITSEYYDGKGNKITEEEYYEIIK